ncbi:hypothetical protein [Providencia sp. Je.9.19]
MSNQQVRVKKKPPSGGFFASEICHQKRQVATKWRQGGGVGF